MITATHHLQARNRFASTWFLLLAAGGVWLYLSISGGIQASRNPEDLYSDQLQAWSQGHTYLSYTPNPALAKLSNPYDGRLNRRYRLLDLCYYHNRYYSYFGVGPIVLLGLPWHAVAGTFLRQQSMVGLFISGSLVLSLYLLYQIWNHYLRLVPFPIVAAASLVVTIGNLGLLHLLTPSFYQVAQSGANFCQMASLTACLLLLKQPRAWKLWLSLGGFAAGLAVACRPSFIFGGIALVPICFWVAHWRQANSQRRYWPSLFTALAIAASPAAAICGAILAYNWRRFDSPFEFGSSYVLAGTDQRGMILASLRYAGVNLKYFLFNQPETLHYFPFYRTPVKPIGLIYFPFLAGAGAVVLTLGARFRPSIAGLRALGFALLFATLGIFGFLAVYVESWLRYEVDFYLPAVLTASIGWMIAYGASAQRVWARVSVTAFSAFFAVITVTNVLLISAAACDPRRLEGTALIVNRAIGWIDASRGYTFGPLRLNITLPNAPHPGSTRLVSTGPQESDWVYLESAADGRVRLGYFHSGVGGPTTEWFKPGPGRVHAVRIVMGSLLPPEQQAFFKGWNAADIYRAKHLLQLVWDGNEMLRADCDFYPSGPNEVEIGVSSADSSHPASPPATIESSVREPFDRTLIGPAPPYRGYAQLAVRFPQVRTDRIEPLLAIGTPLAGDLLFVHYLAEGEVQFGIDDWGQGAFEGHPIRVDLSKLHALSVHLGNLDSTHPAEHALVVLLDGDAVLDTERSFHATAADDVFWGLNSVNSSIASGMFSGTLERISPLARAEFERLYRSPLPPTIHPRGGRISFSVQFDYTSSRIGQPLIVTGRPGAGDFVYVVYDNEHSAHFAFDHWGVGALVGGSVNLDYSRSHRVTVTAGFLRDPASSSNTKPDALEVTLDGQTVLSGKSGFHPTTLEQIEIGHNEIGGSSCGLVLSGRILAVEPANSPKR